MRLHCTKCYTNFEQPNSINDNNQVPDCTIDDINRKVPDYTIDDINRKYSRSQITVAITIDKSNWHYLRYYYPRPEIFDWITHVATTNRHHPQHHRKSSCILAVTICDSNRQFQKLDSTIDDSNWHHPRYLQYQMLNYTINDNYWQYKQSCKQNTLYLASNIDDNNNTLPHHCTSGSHSL